MSLFKTFRGNKSNLPQAINDGAIYALQDVEELYIDISENKRIKISDIIEIENKEALPLAPLENKFYYVKDIGSLYKYNGTEYLEISQSPLYIDFTLENSDYSADKQPFYSFTTTFSFEKAVEEYKKGRKIIAKLLFLLPGQNFLTLMGCVDLEYYEEGNLFTGSPFLVRELAQEGRMLSGQFAWGKISSSETPTALLRLDALGTTPTPEMIGMGDGVLLKNEKMKLPIIVGWISMAYGNGKFVAVNEDYGFAYSVDGVNWNEASMPFSDKGWTSITYGDGKFVAISPNVTAFSTDGINWSKGEQLPAPSSGVLDMYHWTSITYGNGVFVAVDYAENEIIYSKDGINWSKKTKAPLSSGNWHSVTYGNGKFVVIAADAAAYSTDGMIWTNTTLPSVEEWISITYGNGMFVAVALSGVAAYSMDGISWTKVTLPSSFAAQLICYGGNCFVAIRSYYENETKEAIYSLDGIHWTSTTLPDVANWIAISYGNNKFITIAHNGEIAHSTDGINWYDSGNKLVKPDGTNITEDVRSLMAPSAMTEDEIIALWNSIE